AVRRRRKRQTCCIDLLNRKTSFEPYSDSAALTLYSGEVSRIACTEQPVRLKCSKAPNGWWLVTVPTSLLYNREAVDGRRASEHLHLSVHARNVIVPRRYCFNRFTIC
uniref:Uncharacterized protein n=1 Tax=Parascaris univalens TaxID=6257 RepID=A0A915AZ58_PARUN